MPSGKIYAYEVRSVWDAEKKQSRAVSKYLGIVNVDGSITTKSTADERKVQQRIKKLSIQKERLIQNFGNGFLITESIKKSAIYQPLIELFEKKPALLALMAYRLCQPGAPMYNAHVWMQGNFLHAEKKIPPLSSQDISRLLAFLGDESVQREFFGKYLTIEEKHSKNIIIDATSLPNQSASDFNAWGYASGSVETQFRFHCVVDQVTKKPLFYRHLPGNITDVSTLQTTIQELKKQGFQYNFALMDAGYCSESNIHILRENNIDFLMRLTAKTRLYQDMMRQHASALENMSNVVNYGKRTLFAQVVKHDLYGAPGYFYLLLDPEKKVKDIQSLIEKRNVQSEEERDDEADKYLFSKAGIFILISSKEIPKQDILEAYYTRQSIEQIFGFAKDDLDCLPLRCHSEDTIRGYLFLQFLLLIVFIEIRQKLFNHFTVDQAILITSALKCKIYSDQLIIPELTKEQKKIFALAGILVPIEITGI